MIHHGCSFSENDIDHPMLGKFKQKPTMAGVGEHGYLRCCECGRRVCLSDGTVQADSESPPTVDGPYPTGWCSDTPEQLALKEELEA